MQFPTAVLYIGYALITGMIPESSKSIDWRGNGTKVLDLLRIPGTNARAVCKGLASRVRDKTAHHVPFWDKNRIAHRMHGKPRCVVKREEQDQATTARPIFAKIVEFTLTSPPDCCCCSGTTPWICFITVHAFHTTNYDYGHYHFLHMMLYVRR